MSKPSGSSPKLSVTKIFSPAVSSKVQATDPCSAYDLEKIMWVWVKIKALADRRF